MDGITGAAKGIVTMTAGLLMTVFVGLLSLKGSLAGAADSVTLRTAKLAAGAVLPVVGGAVSDALSSVQGSMSLLRSSVGGFASIAVMAMLLPPVLSLLLTQAAMSAASAVARILHADQGGGALSERSVGSFPALRTYRRFRRVDCGVARHTASCGGRVDEYGRNSDDGHGALYYSGDYGGIVYAAALRKIPRHHEICCQPFFCSAV